MAFAALERVVAGGYATDLLLELTAGLDSRDAGLASQIVFGCLRYQGQLDFLIRHYSRRKPEDVEEPVRIALRMGLFQLRYLDRIPVHAAVHESVELAKSYRRIAAGFVNAVLRKVNRAPVKWPDEATALSCPAWLMDRWDKHFGSGQGGKIAAAALEEPARYIRIRPGEPIPAGLDLAPTDVPGCFQLVSGSAASMRLHDIGSQAIVPLLDLLPGQTYLDLCAAPGNKTVQALETGVKAIACDISETRIRQIPAVCPRVVLDGTRPLPFSRKFDRIFIDAPCSGTGTLSRNPEIKWRVEPEDLLRFQKRQAAILGRALDQLEPGGKLVYATCSLEEEENEDVVRAAVRKRRGIRIVKEMWRLPGREAGDGFFAAVLTSNQSASVDAGREATL
jgi:16S rRNA (cytosine967-C5)-methyltransferase